MAKGRILLIVVILVIVGVLAVAGYLVFGRRGGATGLERIDLALRAGNYDRALDLAKQYAAENPGNWEGHYKQAMAHMGLGQYDDARSTLDKAAKAAPKEAKVAMLRADTYSLPAARSLSGKGTAPSADDLTRAIEQLTQAEAILIAITDVTGDAAIDVPEKLGLVQLNIGKSKAILTERLRQEEAVARAAGATDQAAAKRKAHEKTWREAEAIQKKAMAALLSVVERDPSRDAAANALVQLCLDRGDSETLKKIKDKLDKLVESAPLAAALLAQHDFISGEYERGSQAWHKALEAMAGRLDDLIAKHPRHKDITQIKIHRSAVAIDAADPKKALEICDAILKTNAQDSRARLLKADALLAMDKTAEAADILLRLKTEFPNSIQAHGRYAEAALAAGDKQLAKQAFRRVTQIPASRPEERGYQAKARVFLTQELLRDGFFDQALAEARAMRDAEPENWLALGLYVQAAAQAKQPALAEDALTATDEAIKAAVKAVAAPNDAQAFDAFLQKAMNLWRMGADHDELAIAKGVLATEATTPQQERERAEAGQKVLAYANRLRYVRGSLWLGVARGHAILASVSKTAEARRKHSQAAKAAAESAAAIEAKTLAERLSVAEALGILGRTDEQEALLSKTVAEYDYSPNVHAQLAEFHVRNGRLMQAIEEFRRAVQLAPARQEYRLALARTCISAGLLPEAEEQIGSVLELDPKHADALFLEAKIRSLRGQPLKPEQEVIAGQLRGLSLALDYLRQGQPEKCRDMCLAIIGETPDDLDALWLLGQAYFVLGEPGKCVEQWAKRVRIAPNDPTVYQQLASVLARGKSLEEAEAALAGTPGAKREQVDAAIGWLLHKEGRFGDAADAYGRLLTRSEVPEGWRQAARFRRAECLTQAGDSDRAIEELNQLARDPVWLERANLAKAGILTSLGKTEDAEALLQELQRTATEKGRENPALLTRIGTFYLQTRQAKRAEEISHELEQIIPNETEPYMLRAAAFGLQLRRDEAADCFRKIIERQPGNLAVRIQLSDMLDNAGKVREAVTTLEELRKLGDTADNVGLYQEATFFSRRGLHKQAVDTLVELAEKTALPEEPKPGEEEAKRSGTTPQVRMHLARAFAGLGEIAEAEEQLQAVPRYASQYADAQIMLANLEPDETKKLKILEDLEKQLPGEAVGPLIQRMRILMQAGKTAEAIQAFQNWVQADPQQRAKLPMPLVQLAVLSMIRQGNLAEAAQLAVQVARRTGSSRWRAMAALLMLDDRPQTAKSMLPEVSKAYVHSVAVGVILAVKGADTMDKWTQRVAEIEARYAERKSRMSVPPRYKALLALASGQIEEAERQLAAVGDEDVVSSEVLKELIASAKGNPAVRGEVADLMKAAVAWDLGLLDLARQWANDMLKKRPTFQYAAFIASRGVIDPAALREIRQTLKPDDCLLARMLDATILVQERKNDEAADVYAQCVQASGGHTGFILNQAMALERAGKLAEALPLYVQVWEKTKSPTTANNAAYLLTALSPKDQAKLAQASVMADAAVAKAPAAPSFRDTRGWVAFLMGRTEKALEDLRSAVKGLPESPEVQYHLGLAEITGGDKEFGRWHLEAAVGLGDAMTARGATIPEAVAKAVQDAKDALAKLGKAQG